jgi:hypothetical protein
MARYNIENSISLFNFDIQDIYSHSIIQLIINYASIKRSNICLVDHVNVENERRDQGVKLVHKFLWTMFRTYLIEEDTDRMVVGGELLQLKYSLWLSDTQSCEF